MLTRPSVARPVSQTLLGGLLLRLPRLRLPAVRLILARLPRLFPVLIGRLGCGGVHHLAYLLSFTSDISFL